MMPMGHEQAAMVPLAKRWKILLSQRAEANTQKAAERTNTLAAWLEVFHALASAADGAVDCTGDVCTIP